MGKKNKLICKTCGKIYDTKIGCGISHGRLENVIPIFNDKDRAEIEKLWKASLFPVFQFEYKSGYCRFCNQIVSIPVLNFMREEKEFFGDCEVCGHSLKEDSVTEVLCPNCHNSQWDVIVDGRWD